MNAVAENHGLREERRPGVHAGQKKQVFLLEFTIKRQAG